MKKIILAITLTVLLSQTTKSVDYVILTSPILGLIDGKSYAIDGEVFGLLLKVRRDIRELLFGKKDINDKYVGVYEFNGKLYSITELSTLETQLKREYSEKLSLLNSEKENYSDQDFKTELNELEQEQQKEAKVIKELVEFVKDEFLEITKQYIDSIRGFKDQILLLISDSCKQRGKETCFMMKWGEEKEGEEGRLLKAEINTFEGLEDFCSDLANFLEDMARSCPKGKALFIEMIKSKK